MTDKIKNKNPEHFASAKALNLPISAKHSIEISKSLRYKSTDYAKRFLEEVSVLKRAVPFNRFNRDMGHKAGMSAGRYPQKAAKEFLKLIQSVEANAQFKGLNTSHLKIVKIIANKASVPVTGGRHRYGTKRTNLEVEVKEAAKKKEVKKKEVSKKEQKTETKIEAKKEAKTDKVVKEVKTEAPLEQESNEKKTEAVESNVPKKEEQIKEKPAKEEATIDNEKKEENQEEVQKQ